MIAVQHAPVPKVQEIEPELDDVPEEEVIVPETLRQMTERPTLPPLGNDAPTQVSVRYEKPQTETHIPSVPPFIPVERPRERPLLNTDGSLPVLYKPRQPERVPTTRRTISLLLGLSCIFFLLASGILVYVLTNNKPTSSGNSLHLTVNPSIVRASDTFTLSGSGFTPSTQVKFTYDDSKPLNDSMGRQLTAIVDRHNSFSIDVITPTSWSAGVHNMYAFDNEQQASAKASLTVEPPSEASPLLQISTTNVDLGTNAAGTTSSKQITLKNAGGGKLTWQSKSDAAWLTVAPIGNSGYTFAGSMAVNIAVNRSNLAPKEKYTGHIVFSQKDGSNSSKLTVTMGVNSTPAVLNVSPSSLTFAASNAQTVPTQSVMLQNSSSKPLSWQAAATTNDGANWLTVGTTRGSIDAGQSQTLVVGVQAQLLAAGSYQGAIVLTGGANATINVSLSVLAAGNIVVTPTSLNFSGLTQQSVASKGLVLQNTGGQAQTWSASVDSGNWLSVSPSSGSVNAGTQTPIAVNINAAGLTANNYQGNITFMVGNQISIVPITLMLTTPPAAAISVQPGALNFQTNLHTNPVGQSLTITNTGNGVLHWVASESGNGASFAPLSVSSGTISPQGSSVIQVNPSVSTLGPGTLKTTITIADSDAGTTVGSQQVPVTINIQSQAEISTSPVNFSVTTGATTPMTQTVTIMNTGTATLNWSAAIHTDDGGTWLSVNTTSGSLAPGASQNIIVSCDSTGLTKSKIYQGSIIINDSDTGTNVSPSTVYLSFFT